MLMHSIRTKTMLLTVCAILIAMTVATVFSAVSVRDLGKRSSDQILRLLCETGQKNLDSYFESVEQSVETVSSYAQADLAHTPPEELGAHLARVSEVFEKTARNTQGILTYYYRIDPEASAQETGFWYVDLDGEGFLPHEVTDISLYDTEDQSALVWFTVPKATGEGIWLPPYVTENLDVYVLSYNVPIYREGRFLGVIGIEIDYRTMAETVDNISLYDNGYAFINDDEGNIIYHPRMAMEDLRGERKPKTPEGLLGEDNFVRYRFEGVEKRGVWLPLSNGMRLNVAVPVSEINQSWYGLIREIVFVSVILLILFALLALRLSGRITKPLRDLTEAARQVNEGDYEVELAYQGDDEVGILTRSFRQLIGHLKVYISDLNSLAYADALTSVHNKGAFDIYVRELDTLLRSGEEVQDFAVCVFDCDNLKSVNDRFGHENGDVYLKASSHLICRVFQHSPVFRTGGDEFCAVLQGEDYRKREELASYFARRCEEISANAEREWERVSVTMGMSDYRPKEDRCVMDVIRRADGRMYEEKRRKKAGR